MSRKGKRGGRRRSDRTVDPDAPLEIEKYRELIPDFDRFLEVVRTREPRTVRTNTLRITPAELRRRLEAKGYGVHDVPHQPEFFRITREGEDDLPPVSDTVEHWAGHFYIQQTVTGWAAPLLDPQPGDRVLDMCSAPGGKTTHLAEHMGGEGVVVAAEVNEGRIRALLGNVYRMAHPNVLVVAADGRDFPGGATFDRVMVDVPCSAEGTLRKKKGVVPRKTKGARQKLHRTQVALLRRAIELTRPGGTLLYCTCTFDPAENEAVLTEVLRDAPVDVDELEVPVPHERGVTTWGEETYDPRMSRAIRMYPHIHDSGGLFLCRLRKEGDAPIEGWTAVPDIFPEDERYPDQDLMTPREAIAEVEDFYGLDRAVMDRFGYMRRGTNVWVHGLDAWPIETWEPGRWRSISNGFRAFDLNAAYPRPTNDLFQLLDDAVGKRRVVLDPDGWTDLLAGRRVRVDEPPHGYVALVLAGEVVGRGFVREGVLTSQIPRGRTRWLRAAVELEAKHAGADEPPPTPA
jgi:NOL1/NOP2/sun family putative RNA methylase